MSTDTEPQSGHRYGYPDDPQPQATPEWEPEPDIEPGVHRMSRQRPDTDAQLVLRALAWAALWFVAAYAIAAPLFARWALTAATVPAALVVLWIVRSRR
jgi:hypothetical protein